MATASPLLRRNKGKSSTGLSWSPSALQQRAKEGSKPMFGFSLIQLKSAGFQVEELQRVGYRAAELRDAGFPLRALYRSGFTPKQLNAAGFSLRELKSELDLTRYGSAWQHDAAELKAAGFSARDLKNAGFTCMQLRAAHFKPADLRASYSVKEMPATRSKR